MTKTQETSSGLGADAASWACNHTASDPIAGLPPIHPGEVLWASFMQPMGLSVEKVAEAVGVGPQSLQAVVDGDRPVESDLGWRLERYFGTVSQYWNRLQQEFDQETSSAG